MEVNLEDIVAELVEQHIKPKTVWDRPVPIIRSNTLINAYISDNIRDPYNFDELCHTLMYDTTADDRVNLHINTPGGMIDSANQICFAIDSTPATVIGYLTGTVASAGTMIAMHCDDLIVADGVNFMIHNYSSGIVGKGHEIKAQQAFVDAELNRTFYTLYAGFLTPAEIKAVINGKDMWMGKDEVLQRWERRKAVRNQPIEIPPLTYKPKRGRPRKEQ